MAETKYPESVMGYIRQNMGLEPFDTSFDDTIAKMPRKEALNRVCDWNGLINYGGAIRSWVEAIYSVKLEEV